MNILAGVMFAGLIGGLLLSTSPSSKDVSTYKEQAWCDVMVRKRYDEHLRRADNYKKSGDYVRARQELDACKLLTPELVRCSLIEKRWNKLTRANQ